MNIDLIRKRYYSDIPEADFLKVVKADPTSLGGKRIGRYSKWLFRLYRELPIVERFVEEDLPKATGYLKAFDRYKYRLLENQRDINVYKSLSDLYLAVKPFIDGDKPITRMDVIRDIKADAEKVYEDEKWLVVIPHTEEAACLYGAHTQWCTAAREHNCFKQYDKQGSLYINIDKQNNRKYQFHFESNQFMDENDKAIEKDVLEIIGATNGLKMFYKNRLSTIDFLRFQFVIGKFKEGLAEVRLNGKWGFIDKSGKVVIPLNYDFANGFNEGCAQVSLNGKYGAIDKNGKEVIPFKYQFVGVFNEGLATVQLNKKWGYVDKSGKEVIPCKYQLGNRFNEGRAAVNLTGTYGFIDKHGKVVIPYLYDLAFEFIEGLAQVKLNDKWGYIDKSGREVIPCKYDEMRDFYDGLAAVQLNDKWGFIDKNGREVIPLKYDYIGGFSDGLAAVQLNGKWGFIDKNRREVIPPKYDSVWNFSEGGGALVQLNDKWGFIDKNGREVIPIERVAGNA